jgi:hypothetical protein
VLTKATRWIGRATNVEGFAIFRTQQVAAVESRNWPAFDLETVGHGWIAGRGEVGVVVDRTPKACNGQPC